MEARVGFFILPALAFFICLITRFGTARHLPHCLKDISFPRFKNLLYEDQIEPHPFSFQCDTIGKILSLLKIRKTPIIFGWFHTDFLPCNC